VLLGALRSLFPIQHGLFVELRACPGENEGSALTLAALQLTPAGPHQVRLRIDFDLSSALSRWVLVANRP
jgi:hypothetical protein